MNTPEVEAFLTHLTVQQNVSPSTQNQALSALLFLYRNVLNIELTGRIDAVRANRDKRLPVVLTKAEAQTVTIQTDQSLIGLQRLREGYTVDRSHSS